MLNSLSLIILIVMSLLLAFYCVDSHRDNILNIVNMEKNSSVSIREENLSNQEAKDVVESEIKEDVYVEVLAKEDKNRSTEVAEQKSADVQKLSTFEEREEKKLQVEEQFENLMEIEENRSEPIKVEEPIEKVVSENSEKYKLDDLEKMIIEELKKENKE